MKKRILCIFLILTFIFTSNVYAVKYTDVENERLEEILTVLNSFGILEGYSDGAFAPQNKVTRAEFADNAAKLYGDGLIKEAGNPFSDVEDNYWAKESIAALYRLGIVSGSNGEFFPKDEITLGEAAKILLSILKYNLYAESKGGFPVGYIAVANEIGLLKGVKATHDSLLTRDAAAQLIFNALEIPVQKYGSVYEPDGNYDDILKIYHKIEKVRGRVDADYYTTLSGKSSLDKGEISINGRIVSVGETDAGDYLANVITAYLKKDDNTDKYTVFAFYPENNESITEIEAKDIISVSDSRIEYEKNNSSASISIPHGTKVIYNGCFLGMMGTSSVGAATLDIDYGRIKYIKGSSGEGYIFVTEYIPGAVESVNNTSNTVYFKNGVNAVVIDTEADDRFEKLYKDNNAAEFKSIQENDILELYYSGETLVYARIVNNTVSGTVTKTDSKGVYVKGTRYRLAGYLSVSDFEAGKDYDLYCDSNMNVIYSESASSKNSNYGYLVNYKTIQENMKEFLKCKIYTPDGTFKVYESVEKYRVDGERGADLGSKLMWTHKDGTVRYDNLIKYKLNDKNQITNIETPKREDGTGSFSMDFRGDAYMSGGTTMIKSFIKAGDMVSFCIPDDLNDEDAFGTKLPTAEKDYYLAVYDSDDVYRIGAAVVYAAAGGFDLTTVHHADSPFLIIDDVGEMLGKDESLERAVSGYRNGERVQMVLGSNFEMNFDLGDVVRINTSASGKIIEALPIVDLSEKKFFQSESGYGYNLLAYDTVVNIYGEVKRRKDTIVIASVGDFNYPCCFQNDTKIYVYNTKKEQLRLGTVEDFTMGSPAYIQVFRGNVREAVVYEY